MFISTVRRLSGSITYGNWPWPTRFPLKSSWFYRLSRRNSIADETREYFVVGDILLCFVLTYSAYRIYQLSFRSNAYQTHLCMLNGYPPAIIANDFDFDNLTNNRTVSREVLDKYRQEVVNCKSTSKPVETVIFNYEQFCKPLLKNL